MYQRAANQKTGAGALNDNFGLTKPNPNAYGAGDAGAEVTSGLVNWSVTQGRVFIVRVTLAFLYATGMLAFLGFLSTLGADSDQGDSMWDRKRRYLCALSVVVNMVAVAHYKMITKIRGYEFGAGTTAATFAENKVSAFGAHNPKIAIGVEMAVDGIRHSDWMVRTRIDLHTTTLPAPTTRPWYVCADHAHLPHLQDLLHCRLRGRRRHPQDGRRLRDPGHRRWLRRAHGGAQRNRSHRYRRGVGLPFQFWAVSRRRHPVGSLRGHHGSHHRRH